MGKVRFTMKKKKNIRKIFERTLMMVLGLYGFISFLQLLSQIIAYSKILPNLDQIEIGALLLFVTNLRLISVEFILCIGFILIYLAIKNERRLEK